ncbi:MAG: hypothetical protein IJX78_04515, partial [Bacilli bacterium]|nr:hypothetical protein [Bacilli bacterium]
FAHYGDYLYSDTYKWAKEGWIDYLLPQSYWAFEHPSAGYADVMDWWNRAFEGLDCLLYSGIGYYMADSSGNASWSTNMNELTNQLKFLNTLENVDGYSMYSFKYMRWAYEGGTKNSALQVNNAYKAGCFDDVALVPEIETMEPIVLGDVEGLKVNGNTLTFNKNNDAKAYVIYRSNGEITFDETEIVDVIGGVTDTITWQDKDNGTYNYAVCPLSRTNTVGGKAYYSEIENDFNSLTLPESTSTDFAVPNIDGVSWQLMPTTYAKINGNMVEIKRQIENVTITLNATISINGKILSKEFVVTIIGKGLPSFPLETDTSATTSLLGTEVTKNGGAVNGDTIQVGYTRCLFLGEGAPTSWRQQYNLSSSNPDVATIDIYGVIKAKSQGKTTIRAEYKSNPSLWGEIEIYVYNQKGTLHTITFKDSDGTVLDTQRVFEGDVITAPVVIDKYINKVYYDFIGWDKDFSNIKADMEVVAMYKATEMEYIAGDVDNNAVVDTQDVIYLLYHLMFGDSYPVSQVIDYNKDGIVNTDDVTYLLYNVMFGSELYPLV